MQWDTRLKMPKTALEDWLKSPRSLILILRNAGEPIGLCEFDGVGTPEIELVHFGLLPTAQGKRFGKYFLSIALQEAWSRSPKRIWLHTDTNDHPHARAVYESAGFHAYDQRLENFPD